MKKNKRYIKNMMFFFGNLIIIILVVFYFGNKYIDSHFRNHKVIEYKMMDIDMGPYLLYDNYDLWDKYGPVRNKTLTKQDLDTFSKYKKVYLFAADSLKTRQFVDTGLKNSTLNDCLVIMYVKPKKYYFDDPQGITKIQEMYVFEDMLVKRYPNVKILYDVNNLILNSRKIKDLPFEIK